MLDVRMKFVTQVVLPDDPTPESAAATLRTALDEYRVIRISGGPAIEPVHKRWEAILGLLGRIDRRGENPLTKERIDAAWGDVRYVPNHPSGSYRHSNTLQPFHTDGSYSSDPPNVNFFYCENAADSGGETFFLDGPDLVECLRKDRPDLLQALSRVPVHFQKGDTPGQKTPVIKFDEFGPLLDWNENRVIAEQGSAIESMTADFAQYLRVFSTAPSVLQIRLDPGESIIFHEQRVLHGRHAFVGNRCIWTLHMHFEQTRNQQSVQNSIAEHV